MTDRAEPRGDPQQGPPQQDHGRGQGGRLRHGDAVIAATLEAAGADRFAVSGFVEALRLRRAGVTKPILILGYTSPQQAALLARNAITQTVYSLEYARQLSAAATAAGVDVRVHIKLDTGMGRIGFAVRDDLEGALAEVCEATALPGLVHTGVFTHFAVADSAAEEDVAYTRRQYELFCEAIRRLEQKGVTFAVRHCCNSAGILAYPEFQLDMVRPGIILYGYRPSPDVTCDELVGALELKAVVSLVKELRRGDDVSYGRLYTAPRQMRVATLSVGLCRRLPAGAVQLRRRLDPRQARAGDRPGLHDQIIVDVTDIPKVRQGDVATIFGGGGGRHGGRHRRQVRHRQLRDHLRHRPAGCRGSTPGAGGRFR